MRGPTTPACASARSAGADAQQPRRRSAASRSQSCGLGHAPVDVVIAAAYRHVVELLGIVRQARRHVDGQARAGAARRPAHHPPGRVDLPAASAVIAGQAQGVDETREGGQRELVQQRCQPRARVFPSREHRHRLYRERLGWGGSGGCMTQLFKLCPALQAGFPGIHQDADVAEQCPDHGSTNDKGNPTWQHSSAAPLAPRTPRG